jgi:hypothetical protein
LPMPGAPLTTMPARSPARASRAMANSSSRPTRGHEPGGTLRMLRRARGVDGRSRRSPGGGPD